MKKTLNRISSLILALVCVFSIMVVPSSAVETRATRDPTTLAPESWYWVSHQFTATYYTFSSYLIDGSRLNIIAATCDKPFSIEVYTTNDFVIRNEGNTPITSNDHGWVDVSWYDYIR